VRASGYQPSAAGSILGFARGNLAAYKRVRHPEFAELTKTISAESSCAAERASSTRTGWRGPKASTTTATFPNSAVERLHNTRRRDDTTRHFTSAGTDGAWSDLDRKRAARQSVIDLIVRRWRCLT
jgi:hypothetical protein